MQKKPAFVIVPITSSSVDTEETCFCYRSHHFYFSRCRRNMLFIVPITSTSVDAEETCFCYRSHHFYFSRCRRNMLLLSLPSLLLQQMQKKHAFVVVPITSTSVDAEKTCFCYRSHHFYFSRCRRNLLLLSFPSLLLQ